MNSSSSRAAFTASGVCPQTVTLANECGSESERGGGSSERPAAGAVAARILDPHLDAVSLADLADVLALSKDGC